MAQPARIKTSVLDIAYEQSGPSDSLPVLLLHGFPYDPRGFDEVAAMVNAAGLPHHRSVSGRLWRHAVLVGGNLAFGRASRAWTGFAGIATKDKSKEGILDEAEEEDVIGAKEE